MAVDAATTTRYNQVGEREQLSNKIYDLSPMDTPFMTAIGRGKAATNTKVEWQTDALAAAAENAHLDGDDATYEAATATVRLTNHTQIFRKEISVSGTSQSLSTAGRKNELIYQLDKRTREIKRDIERAITNNRASHAGVDKTTARTLGGFEAWIETNASRGGSGADGGFNTGTSIVDAATDGTQRAFSEALLKAGIKSVWDETGEHSPLIIVGSFNKQTASGFSGIATQYQDHGNAKSSKNVAILGAADIYVSDFGMHKIVPDHFSRDRTAMLVNPDQWEVNYLRPFKVQTLAKTGDADKRMLISELTLCSKNEKGSGVIADLLTS